MRFRSARDGDAGKMAILMMIAGVMFFVWGIFIYTQNRALLKEMSVARAEVVSSEIRTTGTRNRSIVNDIEVVYNVDNVEYRASMTLDGSGVKKGDEIPVYFYEGKPESVVSNDPFRSNPNFFIVGGVFAAALGMATWIRNK